MTAWSGAPGLVAYRDGVTVICELAAQFSPETWDAPTPCAEWRAADLAGHLRCVADDYHEYLDEAPASRLARLMATGAHPDTLGRKLARQNAAELAALPDRPAPEHIEAFAESARGYARRLIARLGPAAPSATGTPWSPSAGMAGAACVEWHLHAWDLARALGKDVPPGQPGDRAGGRAHRRTAAPAGHRPRHRRSLADAAARAGTVTRPGRAGQPAMMS